jgi:Dihaem cytochrome c
MRSLLISSKLIILLLGIYSAISYADVDGGGIFLDCYKTKSPGVSTVKFQQYNEICGSCHFPYQPGLLPAVSWEKIIADADNHHGEKLKLSPVELNTMRRYLLDNSAGRVNDEISNNILRTLKYEPVVTRITKTPYIVKMHSQLDNEDKMKNFGQCDSCHQGATQGKY